MSNFLETASKIWVWQLKPNLIFESNTQAEIVIRGGSRATAASKMERFVIIVNGWKPLTIITKRSILDVATVLDPPLVMIVFLLCIAVKFFPS